MATTRNYKKEYANYHGKPKQKVARASRNAARTKMAKAGLVRKGDGKDVTHLTGNPLNNTRLGVAPKSVNRSYARTKTAGKKNPRS
tara:strand:- start:216 stop:473 length:258 start_codon:yes stop_codon:yes gene_type:complete